MYVRLRRTRLHKTPVGLSALCGILFRHIPAHRKPTVCLIRWAGTSYTTGTLCEIGAKFKLYIDKFEFMI